MNGTSGVSPSDRRTAIADAVITVLAAHGSRGLTHRAVDRELDLPEGSTSAYLRTRASLFIAATKRLAELDHDALGALDAKLLASDVNATPAQVVAAIVNDWTTPQTAPRQLARIELQLEAVRNSAVADALSVQRRGFILLVRKTLRDWRGNEQVGNVAIPEALAGVLTALVDGLIADRLLHDRTAVPANHLAPALAELFRDHESRSRDVTFVTE